MDNKERGRTEPLISTGSYRVSRIGVEKNIFYLSLWGYQDVMELPLEYENTDWQGILRIHRTGDPIYDVSEIYLPSATRERRRGAVTLDILFLPESNGRSRRKCGAIHAPLWEMLIITGMYSPENRRRVYFS